MAPISRREQLELDELLSDIYRGIETLPDRSNGNNKSQNLFTSREFDLEDTHTKRTVGHAYVREYELDESEPLVQRYKQEIAAASGRKQAQQAQQPQRSTLKRQSQQRVGTPASQSLASFVASNPLAPAPRATPEHKRRVRIVDQRAPPTEYIDGGAQSGSNDDDDDDDEADYPAEQNYVGSPFDSRQKVGGGKKQKVKYVNTNKLIYHREKDPENYEQQREEEKEELDNEQNDDLDDIDGTTRVEYYHTTWLDRQLGRASKRRSSKELNERQVKEKAMIEELKRSLKSGAITLRQSFKGNNKQQKNFDKKSHDLVLPAESFERQDLRQHQIRDDYFARKGGASGGNSKKPSNKWIFGSGLATLPRNYYNQNNSTSSSATKQKHKQTESAGAYYREPARNTSEAEQRVSGPHTSKEPVAAAAAAASTLNRQPQRHASPMQFSRTLPHKRSQEHQLLQSHYRDGKQQALQQQQHQPSATMAYQQQQQNFSPRPLDQQLTSNSANTIKNNSQLNNAQWCASNDNTFYQQQRELQQQQVHSSGTKSPLQQQASSTLNRMPSATEVVRSALSRSGSQISLNQLNKTINLLPTSPPPYAPSTTPTQNLAAASPLLSPSPVDWNHQQQQAAGCAPRLPTIQRTGEQGQLVLQGTRTVGRRPQQQPVEQQQQQQQPAYASPHAALMQHRQEQQMRQPNRNSASIREFNELDSLLRSLSPGTGTYRGPGTGVSPAVVRSPAQVSATGPTTQITPGFTSKPSRPSFGGFMKQQQQQQQPQQTPLRQQQQQQPAGDLYARVQKPSAPQTNQPYTIDVTNKTLDEPFDENCVRRTNQNVSEFEPPTELLPSMEDYQNIAKLNPVQNRYWYKPNMSREHAISLLKDKPQGTFIVRDSTSFRGAYGLAVKVSKLPKNVLDNASLRSYNDPSAEFIRHFLIEPAGNGGVRLKGYANEPVFDNLADLIYQHSLTELALPCKLVIPRTDIGDPNFNQKQKQFYEEFLASKELAKHQPYERTSPNGGYRRYPGNVLVHNEHRIIFE